MSINIKECTVIKTMEAMSRCINHMWGLGCYTARAFTERPFRKVTFKLRPRESHGRGPGRGKGRYKGPGKGGLAGTILKPDMLELSTEQWDGGDVGGGL